MTDKTLVINNVIQVDFSERRRKLVDKDLPKPGTLDWAKCIFDNVFRMSDVKDVDIEDILSSVSDDAFIRFIVLLSFAVQELIFLERDEYINLYQDITEVIGPSASFYMGDRNPDQEYHDWLKLIICDIAIFLGVNSDDIEKILNELDKDVLNSFNISLSYVFIRVVDMLEPNDDVK